MKLKDDLFLANAALYRHLSMIAEDEFAVLGMSPSQALCLLQIIRKEGCNPGWLGDQIGLAPSTVSRIIDKLERMQLVERRSKGRNQVLYPTEVAREYEGRIESSWRRLNNRISESIGEDKVASLASELNSIKAGI